MKKRFVRIGFIFLGVFLLNVTAFAQWSYGNHGSYFIANSSYSGSDSPGANSSRSWSYSFGGNFNFVLNPTNVEVIASGIDATAYARAWGQGNPVHTLVNENPYGQAYAQWSWVGSTGSATPVIVHHTSSYSGGVSASGWVFAYWNGSTAEAWPYAVVQPESLFWHVTSGQPVGMQQYYGIVQTDAYAYQADGEDNTPPSLEYDTYSVDAVLSGVDQGTGPDPSSYSGAWSDVDYYEISIDDSYTTAGDLAEIHAEATISLFVNAESTTTASTNLGPEAYCNSSASVDGFTRVTLDF